jgi:hypothetical protein
MADQEFEILARQIFASKVEKGFIPRDLDSDVAQEMINDYASRLEDVINREILDELERRDKVDEFNRILEDDTADPGDYLQRTIPDYPSFMQKSIKVAMREIGGM